MTAVRQSAAMLPIDDLTPHHANVREDLGDLTELAFSIRENGIVQPIVVTEHPTLDGKFLILAGHRRHAAARLVGHPKVPVVIRHGEEAAIDHVVLMLVENLQRSDLNPLEKAEALGALRQQGMSQSEIARRVGIHASQVSYYLMLLDLDEESRELLRNGEARVGDAQALIREQRKTTRASNGAAERGRPVQVEAPWLSLAHPLADKVKTTCDHSTRPKVGRVGCGQCFESAIREDERRRLRIDEAVTR